MARTKLRKMQQEITRKEQAPDRPFGSTFPRISSCEAIGELHARVSGKDLRLPKAKAGSATVGASQQGDPKLHVEQPLLRPLRGLHDHLQLHPLGHGGEPQQALASRAVPHSAGRDL